MKTTAFLAMLVLQTVFFTVTDYIKVGLQIPENYRYASGTETRTVSPEMFDKIKQFEGLKLKAYKCPANVWTIGYGHTKFAKELGQITEEFAEQLLRDDLAVAERVVHEHFPQLEQGQFDALVSFCMNVGEGKFLKSSVYKNTRDGKPASQVCQSLLKWNKGGGRVLRGLTERRKAEAEMFLNS